MKKKFAVLLFGAVLFGLAAPAGATTWPNQGDRDKIVYVYPNQDAYEECKHPVPLEKVEGDFGRKVYVSADQPIIKVTVKSGKDAYEVSKYFEDNWGKIELSKDVSNYVVWVCGDSY